MGTTNKEYTSEDVLHNHILYQSEKLLCEALLRKDIKGIQFIWPIVKAYRKIVNDEYKQYAQRLHDLNKE